MPVSPVPPEYPRSDAVAATARRLRMPVQLVLGESDRMTPVRATEELRQALPQAGLSLLDAGHALMQERPRELAAALLELLGRS